MRSTAIDPDTVTTASDPVFIPMPINLDIAPCTTTTATSSGGGRRRRQPELGRLREGPVDRVPEVRGVRGHLARRRHRLDPADGARLRRDALRLALEPGRGLDQRPHVGRNRGDLLQRRQSHDRRGGSEDSRKTTVEVDRAFWSPSGTTSPIEWRGPASGRALRPTRSTPSTSTRKRRATSATGASAAGADPRWRVARGQQPRVAPRLARLRPAGGGALPCPTRSRGPGPCPRRLCACRAGGASG